MNTVDFDVLHALAISGMADPRALATRAGRDEEELGRELDRFGADGLATHLERRGVWRITPAGRDRHAELLDRAVPAEARDRLRPGYERFLPLNLRFKDTCTRWQLRGGAPNDHSDPGYDRALVADLDELHREVTPVLADLAGVRDRFGRYRDRLAGALGRVHDGDVTAFTGVLCDSYHDVWMELHRDLLLSLRIDRATEDAAEAAGQTAGRPG